MSSWIPSPYAAPGAPPSLPPPPDGAYALRPLSMGEVLDRTFAVYRRNFWLIAGISAISGAVQLLSSAVQMAINHYAFRQHAVPTLTIARGLVAILGALAFYLTAAYTQAATVYALSEVYLGRQTTMKESLHGVSDGWWKYPVIGLWQFFSGAWPAMLLFVPAVALSIFLRGQMGALVALLVLGGILAAAGGVVLYLRNSLGIPVQVVERPGIRAAMRRSKTLTQGAKGTIFVLYLIGTALNFAAAGVIGIVVGVMALTHRGTMLDPTSGFLTTVQAVSMVIGFFTHVVILPIVLVGTAIVYFNQRVKQEGFDLLVMLGGGEAAAAATAELPMYPPVAPGYPPAYPPVYPPVAEAYPPVAPGGFAEAVYPPAAPAEFAPSEPAVAEREPEPPGPSDDTTV